MLSVGYPIRAIRTDKYLYIRNFKPNRWPVGDPKYGYPNCDQAPTMSYILENKDVAKYKKYYTFSFDFRPKEELYNMEKDVDCVNNLADDPKYTHLKNDLSEKLDIILLEQKDPRILGDGEIFDYYPYRVIDAQRELYGKPDYDPVKIYEDYLNSLE